MIEPIQVLGAMITPAVLISAAALLLLSTASRLGRVNDRLSQLMAEMERLRNAGGAAAISTAKQQHIQEHLAGSSERLLLLRSAVTGIYVTIAIFITTSIALGMYALFPRLTNLLPISIGMVGAVAFLYSIALLIAEGALAHRLTLRDIAYVRGLLEETTASGPNAGDAKHG